MTTKRITLLKQKRMMLPEAFRNHWAGPHAEIERHLPGLVRYNQNYVTATNIGRALGEWPIHGFVELWFRDRAAIIEAASSSVTKDLIVDELFFLDGLTGLDVGHSARFDVTPHKIFIVGREVDAGAGESLLEELSPLPGFVFAQVDRVAGITRRDALWSDPEPPTFVAFAGFATFEEVRSAYERIVEQESCAGQQREIYLAEELRIV